MVPIFERLRKRLHPAPNGCLEWRGSQDKDGYGRIGRGRRGEGMECTHRVAYEAAFGPIPMGMNVLHRCDNPPCCEPTHLWLGTDLDNMADRDAKGRTAVQKGERNGNAKLTLGQVEEIRVDARLLREIAADYGVGQSMVSLIRNGKRWAA